MKLAALALTAAVAAAISVPAQAEYIINIDQVGSNVVATGSGSINWTALTFQGFDFNGASVNASAGGLFIPDSAGYGDIYSGMNNGVASFGSGGLFSASSSSAGYPGSIGVNGADEIIVPAGYFAGDPMGAATATWTNQTIAGLGLTPGTYVWNWGNPDAGTADSLTINIGGSVPEPATWAMLMLGVGLVGATLRRRAVAAVA